jgi:hypothetical protein
VRPINAREFYNWNDIEREIQRDARKVVAAFRLVGESPNDLADV